MLWGHVGGIELLLLLLSGQQQGYNNQDDGWGGGIDDHDGRHSSVNNDGLLRGSAATTMDNGSNCRGSMDLRNARMTDIVAADG